MGERLAILTGSAGAVHDAVAAAVRAAGLEVHHVPLLGPGAPRPGAEVRRAELVIHLGLRTPRELDEARRAELEAGAAATAAGLARDLGARRLIHVSSTAVYGRPRNLPCREGELKAPRTTFERIRWRAEQASWGAFRRGTPLTVLRPALLYGPTLRGGPARTLALVALFNQGRRRVPILRRGPVAHLLHLDDLARAVVHVALHPDDRAVQGRAFNVADDAPMPLGEHLEAALTALGYETGRVIPTLPRLIASLLWLVRHVPDRTLLATINRRFARRWHRLADQTGVSGALSPRVDREALHWMSADHYYDTQRLASIGWTPQHPVSSAAFPETVRALVAAQHLPGSAGRPIATW
ncbi:MAG: NAD(P)-dependent oxidoreductase [Anaeromyxobacter sp.]